MNECKNGWFNQKKEAEQKRTKIEKKCLFNFLKNFHCPHAANPETHKLYNYLIKFAKSMAELVTKGVRIQNKALCQFFYFSCCITSQK